MHFFRMWPILPLLPALVVFGLGMTSLYFGKKESSPCLKLGGFVMSLGAIAIMVVLLITLFKPHAGPMCMGDPMNPMNPMMNPMGPKCPMMMQQMMPGQHNGNCCNSMPMPPMPHKK